MSINDTNDRLTIKNNNVLPANSLRGQNIDDCINTLLSGLATDLTPKPQETTIQVHDVIEVATFEALPSIGKAGKIYVVLSTNKLYRWDGKYILLSDSGLTVNQLAALTAAPLLSNTNPVASLKDLGAPAELRRTTGPVLPFATAAAAIAAADAGDSLILRGVHPEVYIAKTLHVIAYGATLAGVTISWHQYPGGLRSTWRGGRLTGRFFTGRTGVPQSLHKCQISDVDFGPGAYLQSHTNNTSHNGAADEFSFYNCRITHIQFNQRAEDINNQRQSIYFSGCSFVPDTAGAIFRGMMYSQSTISAHNCRFQPQPGNALFDAPPNGVGKLSLHGFTTVALPAGITNFLSNGLQVITNADPFAFPLTPEKLSNQADSSVLEFVFEAGFANSVVRTMGIRQAGIYRTELLQNVVEGNVVYKVKDKITELPFEVNSGDKLELSITKREDSNKGAVISLFN